MSRRDALWLMGAFGLVGITRGQEPATAGSSAQNQLVKTFMSDSGVPGLAMAFGRDGVMLREAAYGFADTTKGVTMTQSTLMRIASCSKPLTSLGVFALVEAGKLGLDDKIFGKDGLLPSMKTGAGPAEWINAVTVRHLLTHTAGGWRNETGDPVFAWPELDQHDMIARTLNERKLDFAPGSHYAYSNFGYVLLARVIEARSGLTYEQYVRRAALAKYGAGQMRLGGDKSGAGEATYYGPESYSMQPKKMDGNGGWIATPGDLVKVLMGLGGLSAQSRLVMFTGSSANAGYGCGWGVNGAGTEWHNGGMPGTSSVMVRTERGLCWSAIMNERPEGADLDALMWKVGKCMPGWFASL